MNSLLVEIIKSGTASLVMCKIAKSIGEKDISEIIAGMGWTVCGLDMVLLIMPIIKGIEVLIDKGSAFINGVKSFFEIF